MGPFLLSILAIGIFAAISEAAPGDTADHCRRESGGSYSMEAYCVKREREAYERIMSRGQSIEQRILDYCNPQSNTWSMLDYCIRREEEAKRKLGR